MTKTSLECLMGFLNTYPIHGRIADFGGTHKVGKDVVKKSLAKGGEKDYHVLDLDNGIDLLKPIKGKKFDVGICMDLLEHTSNPFLVSKNIINSLKKGAHLFVTVPFVWELHYHPNDYWRFTPHGVQELFKEMQMIVIYLMRDEAKDEAYPRHRVVGIFKKL